LYVHPCIEKDGGGVNVSQVRRFVGVLFVIILVSALLAGVTPGALADQDSDGGSYDVLIFKNGEWQLQGQLSFSDYETRRLPLDNGAGQLRIRLTQHGHDGAFVDYLALEKGTATFAPASAINVGTSASVLTKVMSPEYDVCDAWNSTLEVVWENAPDNATLVMRAMEEDFGEGHGVPLYYPRIQQGETLSYTLVNDGSISVDGLLQESTEPDFTVFWQPDSPHPDGYTYGWLHSDARFLYAAVEVTADNTSDEEDWGALYLVVDDEMREFRVTDDQEQWGVSGFQYTSSVAYEHRVYEFRIPLNEIAASIGAQIRYGFGCYGTVAVMPTPTKHSTCGMEWDIANTPSWEDLEILPAADILDYDIGGDGDIIYAVLETDQPCNGVGTEGTGPYDYALVKSDDGGITWTDITAKVTGAANLPHPVDRLCLVAVAPDDEDWVAVAGYMGGFYVPFVVASKDGGDNFAYAGDIVNPPVMLTTIYDLDVSIEVDSIHNIALAGMTNEAAGSGRGAVFRLKAGTWLTGAWEDTSDTTDYLGWDNGVTALTEGVVAVAFSPNFDLDDTIVCFGIDDSLSYGGVNGEAYLQSGIWESSSGSWNDQAGFPNAIKITSDGDTLLTGIYNRSIGLALPDDYDGSDPGARSFFVYVNAFNDTTELVGGFIFRVDNSSLSPACGPSGDPLLASIDVHGDADTGKMMIGEYVQWDNDGPDEGVPIEAECCAGVRVWHTEELDFCCPQWDGACKDPSGPYLALVMYTPDGEKQYATTSGTMDDEFFTPYGDAILDVIPFVGNTGTPLDESAFSVSRDDAVSFNQIGLIDTDIDYLSDVAVCPDCGTIYLSTISQDCIHSGCYPCLEGGEAIGYCDCDSVWRSYDDGDTWERVFHGDWSMEGDDPLLLRLPCDAIEDCCDQDPVSPSGTIYLGIWDTDQMFYSRDCGQCWNDPPATKIDIQDFAVESENIVYIIDRYGMFSMSTQYGRRWSDAVDTGMDNGHSITACCHEGFIVAGGYNQPVTWSDDGGDSWNLTDDLPIDGEVHVACDPVCENIIYAALDNDFGDGGILRTDVTTGNWDNLNPLTTSYTGIVVANEGTLYAASNRIHANVDLDCEERFGLVFGNDYSGVARNLDPCETACCGMEDWDYLICGLSPQVLGSEYFDSYPTSLRICGCLSIDTNSVLWAIDTQPYDVTDGAGDSDEYGGLWSYEDCAAKLGPTLTSPADGSVLDCEPCAGCDAANFTLKWERMCCACSYDIEIMDEDGNVVVSWTDLDITGDPPSLFVDGTFDDDSMDYPYYYLECGMTYTWHVREANTDCECVHSPWSETWSFTIAPGAADAIDLLAPTKGALDVPVQNIGFSWTSVRNATSYSFVLSPNANLTGALVSQDMSTTAFNYVGPLDYSKAYYWQIIAWEDSTRLTTSSIGVFNTMAEPVEPTPPVVVEEQPAPVVNIPPAEQITPTWIYAIIGIGAALAVVVIVLIVRTRRP
jgi:hypothetical protein